MASTSKDSNSIIIGSRNSELAMIQSRHVSSILSEHFPKLAITIESKLATGDIILDKPLNEIPTSGGLFTKDLEVRACPFCFYSFSHECRRSKVCSFNTFYPRVGWIDCKAI